MIKGKPFFILHDVSGRLESTLRQRVRLLLLRQGLTQNQLADKIGINKGTMSKIINGDWGASSQLKILIARALEVDSLVLFGNSEYFENWKTTNDYSKEKLNLGEISK